MEFIEISYANRRGYLILQGTQLYTGQAAAEAIEFISQKLGVGPVVEVHLVFSLGDNKWKISFDTRRKYTANDYLEGAMSAGYELVHGMQAAWMLGAIYEFGESDWIGFQNKELASRIGSWVNPMIATVIDEKGITLMPLEEVIEIPFEGDPGVWLNKLQIILEGVYKMDI